MSPCLRGETLPEIALPFPVTPQTRTLAAAISAVAVFGLSIGQSAPLLSLLLEARGTDPFITGLNSASAFIGVIAGPLLTPFWVRRFGIRNFLLASYAIDIALFLALNALPDLAAWFILRALLGLVGSGLFTASEAWINLAAPEGSRGRILGIYAAALSAGFGLGPLLLTITGIHGWAPFLANAACVALAMIPLLLAGNSTHDLGRGRAANPLSFFSRAPLIITVVALFGLFESCLFTFLPIWGVRRGLTVPEAAALVSAIYLGAVVLQIPIGWLSDRAPRRKALRICALAGLAGAIILTALPLPLAPLYCLLLLWGGAASAIYPVALGMAADRFGRTEMVPANAAIIMAYGLGALAGPGLGGLAMDLWNPRGLTALFITLFVVLIFTTRSAQAR